jgi:putative ABC transport system permease protein
VAAVWTRFRVELRTGWRAWLTLAVLTGLAGGFLVAAAAGARRTDSALARHLVAYRFRDARVWPGGNKKKVATLKEVAASSVGEELFGTGRDAQGRAVPEVGPRAVLFYASEDGRDGVTLDRWKLLAGRRPDSSNADEALLDSRAARTFGVRPGDTISVPTYRLRPTVRVRVVGIVAATDPVDYPGGVVRLTPAVARDQPSNCGCYGFVDVRLKRGAEDIPALRRGVARLGGGVVDDQRDKSREIQGSIHDLAQALWFAVALGALLSVLLLAHALARLAASASLQYPTLRAVGMTRRQLIALGVTRAGTIALVAAALAVGTSVALSPLAPVGYARELEPNPGLAIDPLAVGLGGVAVLAAVLLAGVLAAVRAARRGEAGPAGEGLGRVRAADTLARWGLPATLVSGVRLALARGRSSTTPPVGSALVGVILAVVVVGAALTFSASLGHLFSTPRLFGQNWDYRGQLADNLANGSNTPAVAAIVHDPSISAVAQGDDVGTVRVDGRQVGVRAMRNLKGSVPPTVIEGRGPTRDNEVLLGTKTMSALRLRIGNTVEVQGVSLVRRRMRIVGRGILPRGAHNGLGEGAAMTYSAYQRLGLGTSGDFVLQVRIAHGADRARTLAKLERLLGPPDPGPPSVVADFGGIAELPTVISALLVAIAAGALAQTLVLEVRRRRRDLAILKTLGFDRRQLRAAVAWQATTFAAIGLLIGLPLGDALGRWAWNLFADKLGVVPEPVTPLPLLLLVVPGAIILANLVAIVPARIAARTRPGLVLRAE